MVVFTPNRRLRLGPANPPRLLRAVLEQVHWISLEELSQQPNLDPLLNLLTPPLRPPQRSHHRPDPGAAAGAAGSPSRRPARLSGPGRPGRVAGRQPLKRGLGALIRLFRLLYSLYGIAHAMACLPPAVGAHPSGRIGVFPIVSQVAVACVTTST